MAPAARCFAVASRGHEFELWRPRVVDISRLPRFFCWDVESLTARVGPGRQVEARLLYDLYSVSGGVKLLQTNKEHRKRKREGTKIVREIQRMRLRKRERGREICFCFHSSFTFAWICRLQYYKRRLHRCNLSYTFETLQNVAARELRKSDGRLAEWWALRAASRVRRVRFLSAVVLFVFCFFVVVVLFFFVCFLSYLFYFLNFFYSFLSFFSLQLLFLVVVVLFFFVCFLRYLFYFLNFFYFFLSFFSLQLLIFLRKSRTKAAPNHQICVFSVCDRAAKSLIVSQLLRKSEVCLPILHEQTLQSRTCVPHSRFWLARPPPQVVAGHLWKGYWFLL